MSDEDENVGQDAMADDWAAAMNEQEEVDGPPSRDEPEVAEIDELTATEDSFTSGDTKLDVILDIPVTIAMEIGRTKISIRNLLQLNQGSVVELDRLAGEPMDVLVNNTLVAHGEVVVVNEKFGIRLTDVISPAERIKNLK